jgi:hypothetical protein
MIKIIARIILRIIIVLPLILMGTTYTTEKQNKFEFHMSGDGLNDGYIINTENKSGSDVANEIVKLVKNYG